MKTHWRSMLVAAVTALGTWGCDRAHGQGVSVSFGYGELPAERVEVLTRGPVHESFAMPIDLTEDSVVTVTQEPPDALPEAVPSEMPEGAAWVPGYWCWDSDINDFLWVSGCWRVAPPGRSWVSGYWAKVPGGWQWVPGFWAPADVKELEYLPPPPESLEAGPVGAAPAGADLWSPGCWIWQKGRYAWRPGFWQAPNAGWQWIPAHYVWTPRGCIYVEGYWDYMLPNRGVLFAPVYCPRSVYARRGFAYTPTVVIDMELLVKNLFCCPRYDHYYFGDYYDERYAKAGIYPWFESAKHHDYFDPIFAHRQWKNRDTHDWLKTVTEQYVVKQKDEHARPARTYAALQAQMAKLPEDKRNDFHVARPLSSYVENKQSPLKFQHVSADKQAELIHQGSAVRDFRDQRTGWESPVTTGGEHVMSHTGDVHGTPIPSPTPSGTPHFSPPPHVVVTTPPPHVSASPSPTWTPRGTPPPYVTATPPPVFPRVQTTKEPIPFTPHTEKLPPLPVTGPKVTSLEKDYRPPATPIAPTPNPDIKPKFEARGAFVSPSPSPSGTPGGRDRGGDRR